MKELALVFLAFLSECLGTISGFGSSTLFVPTASLFESLHLVLALTSLIHIFSNISKIAIFWKSLDFRLAARFTVPTILFTGLGALMTGSVSPIYAAVTLGLLVVALSLYMLFNIHLKLSRKTSTIFVASGISGFLTGLVGTGGAIRGVALSAFHLEKFQFIATSALIDLGGDIVRAVIYLNYGYLEQEHYFYIPFVFVAALAGIFVGKKVVSKFSNLFFKRLIIASTLAAGVLILFQSLSH